MKHTISLKSYVFGVIWVATLGGSVTESFAVADENALIEGAKLCTLYIPRQERQFGIPNNLLAAIASTESGRYHHTLGITLPWPWTINVEGKGYYFDTKEEAITAVKELQASGHQSIDVGCMQVNLHHHPHAFASIEQAFDPAYNVTYAAQFLKSNFDKEASWKKATGNYHSQTPAFGEPYSRLVFNYWSKIINKVAEARSGKLALQAQPAMALASNIPRYNGVHLHSMSVSKDTTRENGVLVIRPSSGKDMKSQAADNKFVTVVASRVAKAAAQEENTKATTKPDTAVKTDNKGQYQPKSHVETTASLPPQSDGTAPKHNSVFVFDN